LLRNKKIIRQADERAKIKATYLNAKLAAEDEVLAADPADCLAASVSITVSSTIWGTYSLIEEAIRVGESSGLSAESPSVAASSSLSS
jgi:hypothetical protein